MWLFLQPLYKIIVKILVKSLISFFRQNCFSLWKCLKNIFFCNLPVNAPLFTTQKVPLFFKLYSPCVQNQQPDIYQLSSLPFYSSFLCVSSSSSSNVMLLDDSEIYIETVRRHSQVGFVEIGILCVRSSNMASK